MVVVKSKIDLPIFVGVFAGDARQPLGSDVTVWQRLLFGMGMARRCNDRDSGMDNI